MDIISKNSNNVIALNFWRMKLYSVLEDISSHKLWSMKLYSVLEDISSHKPVIQLNVPCFRSCIWHRCFFEEPWFWVDRCSSFSISFDLSCWMKRLGRRRMFPSKINPTFLPFPKSSLKCLQSKHRDYCRLLKHWTVDWSRVCLPDLYQILDHTCFPI